ncbi:HNH endonuclease [Streptomyces phage Blueeyedbeauty]|uniref:HNH endonuclease n=1 Tax=Streptomyces phage Blueeyedbeauty TaxID=2250336 RepID=A0A345L1V6_9CAUD|nr:HNH endonuclease [Streptomyces phage Blueeyedbeauty]AXH49258.1 HNH endonuclease [Streptomyces phage Blueeyedbeauty]
MPYKDVEKQRAAQRAYYEKNKERVKQVARDRRSHVRKYVQEYKQSRGCIDCGIMYPYWVLEFDHCRGEKIAHVTTMITTHSFDEVKNEIEKCDVVCANCHKDRTYQRLVTSGASVLDVVDI